MNEKMKNAISFIIHFLGIDIVLFFAFVFCFFANINIENPVARIFALFLALLGIWLSKVFLESAYKGSNSTVITFMVAMVELGVFLNLYIVGFEANRKFSQIADYWLGITGFIPVTLCIIAVQFLSNPENRKKKTGTFGSVVAVFLIIVSILWVFGCPEVEGMGDVVKQSSKAIIEVAFICAFVAFFDGNIRFFSVDNLGKKVKFYLRVFLGCMICLVIVAFLVRKLTSFRNAILEVLKVFVLLTFSLFYYQKMNLKEESQPQKDNAIKTLIRVLFVDVVIFLAGFLAGEFGTALILSLFVFLLILFVFSSMSEERSGKKNLGKVLAWSIAIFILIFLLLYFLCYSIYLKDSTLTIGLKNLGLYDKLDRIFNLSGNVQIEEMNTAINESPRLFVALPYNVSLAGRLQTRVEDFSFMNIVTVFGSLVGSILMVLMVTVPAKMIQKIEMKYPADKLYSIRNLFCIGGCTLFISNTLIHIIANFGLFLFTGVTLPFISNGFMNMAVFYLIFTQVLRNLDTLNDIKE